MNPMKKIFNLPAQVFSGLLVVMLVTLAGCSQPTDHVGEWNVIEKNGKALDEGTSTVYLFCADNIAAKNEIKEKDGRLEITGYGVERSGDELSLTGIDTEGTEVYQVEVTKDASGKEQMKMSNPNETLLLEKKSAGNPAITDAKYHHLYYPVTVIDDENGMRMTLRFFCNGHLMLDSYMMNYEMDAANNAINVLNQGKKVFQIKMVSDTEWEFGVEGAGSSRKKVKTSQPQH